MVNNAKNNTPVSLKYRQKLILYSEENIEKRVRGEKKELKSRKRKEIKILINSFEEKNKFKGIRD